MQISEILAERGLTAKQVAIHQRIPYTTLQSTFERSVDKWSVGTLRAIAAETDLGVEELLNLLSGNDPLTPFIKWVGGKRQLLGQINQLLPSSFNRYFEPFLGGGAVFLNLTPPNAVVNDFNPELVNVWKVVKQQPEDLMRLLQKHQQNNSKAYYLDLRQTDRDGRIEKMSTVERAARFIYMNKTGFNGLWRVNQAGQNNVPYGRYKNPNICDERILSVSAYLNEHQITILNTDYRKAVEDATKHDFVYFDPPYIPVNLTSSFTAYTNTGFGLKQQEQLRDTFVSLTRKGVYVMLSNADVPLIEELYGKLDSTVIHHVVAKRNINSVGSKRGNVGEVIITNY
ncbi:Dam family site-specific DNA-(adenine-N6)-methyltransferase [Lactiplantibacillus plajomi]|uniref:Site-specific DNA-methyltransferase (adenine-specific) n=1 Tax=Lactiplantibacillus plajomi TaxID=1457217 RepID=A0ABV6K163_9LACO|nr:Dam family site-specific DNA-(adenine-N6)-methyltransferase [Lactiplantibacillus plajomi]